MMTSAQAAASVGALTVNPSFSALAREALVSGRPTRTETQKVDGYDTTTWIYEGTQAPTGLTRMVVDFGLLRAGGFQRATVRALRLEPHPGVFTRDAVLTGWGRPTGVGKEGGVDSFFYEDGLLVIFDKEAWSAVSMLFTLPQPSDQAKPSRW